ncbi:MAG: FMN-dependent NADH-azoreductase [Bradyrhizobiaceae bacterium]|nr:FMN-dependent NADH-azoreductase [Bradyrhizobiaceae bacterium]
MTQILYLKSSPRGDASHSSRVADHTVDELRKAYPGASVKVRDLAREPLLHIDEEYLAGLGKSGDLSEKQQKCNAFADELIAELQAADIVVMAVAMINFSIPSTLKAWIDHVAQSGRTFRYEQDGPKGLLTGKRVILVKAKGGIYSEGPAKAIDFVTPYLAHMLGFMGLTDIETIVVEGTVFGEEQANQAVAQALAHAQRIAGAAEQAA